MNLSFVEKGDFGPRVKINSRHEPKQALAIGGFAKNVMKMDKMYRECIEWPKICLFDPKITNNDPKWP